MRKSVYTPEERVALALRLINLLTDEPQPIDALAQQLGVKRDHIYKMITTLAREGAIVSKRGRTGGGITRKPGAIATLESLAPLLYKTAQPQPLQSEDTYTPLSTGRPEKLTLRQCRKCKARLPQSRYYNCYECQPVLPKTEDDTIYCYLGGNERDEPHG
jgi:biotin operon repressor